MLKSHRSRFYLALPPLLLVVAFITGSGPLATGVYAILLIVLAGWAMTLLWTAPLEVSRELSADVVECGEPVNVTVRLHNPMWWPIPWIYAEETLPKEFHRKGMHRRLLLLPPRRSFFLTYSIIPTRRGCHQIGPLVIETGDVFGLFKRCRIHPRRDFATVLPGYQAIEEFEVGRVRRLGGMSARRSLLEDPTRMAGVREYRRGDPLNHIHWRSSARLGGLTGDLATRIFEPVTEAAATIVLDFNALVWKGMREYRPQLPMEEGAVEIAASVARYLIDGGWRVGFLSNGRDPLGMPGITMAQARGAETLGGAQTAARQRPDDDRLEPVFIAARRGPEQFSILRENLGRIALSDGLALGKTLLGALPHIEREQALVIVAGRVSEELVGAILRARGLGYRVLMLVVGDNPGHDRAFDALAPVGVEMMRMDEGWRLRDIAIGRQHV